MMNNSKTDITISLPRPLLEVVAAAAAGQPLDQHVEQLLNFAMEEKYAQHKVFIDAYRLYVQAQAGAAHE